MRKIHRAAAWLTLCAAVFSLPLDAAFAEDRNYFVNQSQSGVTLPGVTQPGGFDEIRAADGTTCRSAMAGSGAYVDSGVIGGGPDGNRGSLTAYGRIVVPLGEKPKRLNCDSLYQLELRRLQLEVKLLEQGLDPRMNKQAEAGADWASDAGWTTGGRK